jgi:hypothetical protein
MTVYTAEIASPVKMVDSPYVYHLVDHTNNRTKTKIYCGGGDTTVMQTQASHLVMDVVVLFNKRNSKKRGKTGLIPGEIST